MYFHETSGQIPLILYGAGDYGVYIAELLPVVDIIPTAFCDQEKRGICPKTGIPIISPPELMSDYPNAYIMICSENYYDEIWQDISKLGVKTEQIITYEDRINTILDIDYLKMIFEKKMNYLPNFENPVTFNEKLNWLKLNDRNPVYTKLADKLTVREFIAEQIGADYLVPIYGAWDSAEAIDFSSLPEQFVLKCNHDSGSVVVCHDIRQLDIERAKNKLTKRLNTNYYWRSREWVYKDITPRIFASKYLGDNINDYKILTFNGEPKIIQVVYDLFTSQKRNLYTTDWDYLPVSQHFPTDPLHMINKPANLSKMLELAGILSQGIPHVRVDFWEVEGQLYFSEFTFYSDGGFSKFEPYDYDELLGSWLKLPPPLQARTYVRPNHKPS